MSGASAATNERSPGDQYGETHGCKWLMRAPVPRFHWIEYWLVFVLISTMPLALFRTPTPIARP